MAWAEVDPLNEQRAAAQCRPGRPAFSGLEPIGRHAHSERLPKLLISQQANPAKNSECSLIYRQKWVDFDSAIPRFESWRPSQIKH
jgi:hypothetical protein